MTAGEAGTACRDDRRTVQPDGQTEAEVLAELRGGLIRKVVTDDAVTAALRAARAAAWVPYVVTNGTVQQQTRKLRHTGLDHEVAGWVISEGADIRKPDPEIFRYAAIQARQSLDGAWMIGDSAEAVSSMIPSCHGDDSQACG